jgi:hypothetical protein
MTDPTRCFERDSDSDSDTDSSYPVHRHKPHFQTRAGTMANASKYSEYDSHIDDLVNHHNKPQFMTTENSWVLKYQQLFKFYLTHRHCDVPRKAEMATLADWVFVPKN